MRGVGGCPHPLGSEKEGTGLASAPGNLKGGEVLEPGPGFPEKWGRWPCCGLSRQTEHELGAHQSRGTCN